jgi:hypothetical protein
MTLTVTWSEEALRRLHLIAPGSAVPETVRYYFADSREPTNIPLAMPIADPAMNGRAMVRLPGPPGDGPVVGAELIGEDGLVILTVTTEPPLVLSEADTWKFPVELE